MEMLVQLNVLTGMVFTAPTGLVGDYNHGELPGNCLYCSVPGCNFADEVILGLRATWVNKAPESHLIHRIAHSTWMSESQLATNSATTAPNLEYILVMLNELFELSMSQ
jgi:hypothetical protein